MFKTSQQRARPPDPAPDPQARGPLSQWTEAWPAQPAIHRPLIGRRAREQGRPLPLLVKYPNSTCYDLICTVYRLCSMDQARRHTGRPWTTETLKTDVVLLYSLSLSQFVQSRLEKDEYSVGYENVLSSLNVSESNQTERVKIAAIIIATLLSTVGRRVFRATSRLPRWPGTGCAHRRPYR